MKRLLLPLLAAFAPLVLSGCAGAPIQPDTVSDAMLRGEGLDPALVRQGARRFEELTCAHCHATRPKQGGWGGWGGNLSRQWGVERTLKSGSKVIYDAEYAARAIRDPGADVVPGHILSMPSFQDDLQPGDVESLVAYLHWIGLHTPQPSATPAGR